jgi:hypothetical protein
MNKKLRKLIIKQDLSIKDLADDVCDIIINDFGTHNYKCVRDIVNEKLKNKNHLK